MSVFNKEILNAFRISMPRMITPVLMSKIPMSPRRNVTRRVDGCVKRKKSAKRSRVAPMKVIAPRARSLR